MTSPFEDKLISRVKSMADKLDRNSMKNEITPTDEFNGALIGLSVICVTYGIALGTIALGAGLVCLTVVQGIGFGVLGLSLIHI